ncbi:MAG: RibD family protein [bacterium]|nr:RibD family protein [bacterium]MDZ4248343.1 RibD family protein [Patescibacteria group bacterium]
MTPYDEISFGSHPDRPYTFINMVATVDGKAVDPGTRQAPSGGPHDRQAFLALRAHADVLIYGATTGKDVPPEEFLDADFQAARKKAGRDPLMKFVLLSHGGHLSTADKIFGNPDFTPIVYVPEGVELELKNADVRHAGRGGGLDVAAIVQELKRDGADIAICEGGPTTNEPFLRDGLIDEFFLTVSPRILGGNAVLTAVEGEVLPPERGKLELVSAEPAGDEVFLRYRVSVK